jgi:hypothetical protein
VTATRVMITPDGTTEVGPRNLQEVAAMTVAMEAVAIIVMKDPMTMMITMVLAKPCVDAVEDRQVVEAVDHQMMGRVVTLMMSIGVHDDDVEAYRAMTPLLRLLTEPEQKVSSLSSYHLCQSQRVNLMDTGSRYQSHRPSLGQTPTTCRMGRSYHAGSPPQ